MLLNPAIIALENALIIRFSDDSPIIERSTTALLPEINETAVEKKALEFESSPKIEKPVNLIKLDGSKELLCQFPKTFTNVAKSSVFNNLMVRFPILEPVVDVFVGTFDKSVEQKVKSVTDKVADAMMKDTFAENNVITAESEKIVSTVEIDKSLINNERIEKIVSILKQKVKDIDEHIKKIKFQMNIAAKQKATDLPNSGGVPDNMNGVKLMCTCKCGTKVMWGSDRSFQRASMQITMSAETL
jgi:hypothetical protein